MPDVTWPQVVLVVALVFGLLGFLGFVIALAGRYPIRYRRPIEPPKTPRWKSDTYYQGPADDPRSPGKKREE